MTGAAETNGEVRLEGRVSLFGQGEDLVGAAREIWEIIGAEADSVARQFWVQYARAGEGGREIGPSKLDELTRRITPYIEAKYARLDDPAWVATAGEYVATAAAAEVSLTTLFAGIAAGAQQAHDLLIRALAGDYERLVRLGRALTRCTVLEVDIFCAHYDVLRRKAEQERRGAQGADFNKEILSVVEHASSGSRGRDIFARGRDPGRIAQPGIFGLDIGGDAAGKLVELGRADLAAALAGPGILHPELARDAVSLGADNLPDLARGADQILALPEQADPPLEPDLAPGLRYTRHPNTPFHTWWSKRGVTPKRLRCC
jgi:hypothetical protein